MKVLFENLYVQVKAVSLN